MEAVTGRAQIYLSPAWYLMMVSGVWAWHVSVYPFCLISSKLCTTPYQRRIATTSTESPRILRDLLPTSLVRTRPFPHKAWHHAVATRRAPRLAVSPVGRQDLTATMCARVGTLAPWPFYPHAAIYRSRLARPPIAPTPPRVTHPHGTRAAAPPRRPTWSYGNLHHCESVTVGHKRVRID